MFETGELSPSLIQVFNIFIGIVLLVAGRKLFWLAVGAAGFLLGFGLALNYLEIESAGILLLIGVAAGAIGIVAALFLQQIAIVVVGFLLGGYLSVELMQLISVDLTQWEWLVYLVGGVAGSILVSALFGYALIGLSALIGATMIAQSINLSPQLSTLVLIVLFVVGLIIQTRASTSATT